MKKHIILQALITTAYVVACFAGASWLVMFAVAAVDVLAYFQGRNSVT